MRDILRKIDIPLFLVSIILIILGLIMIFSASSVVTILQYKVNVYYFFERQLIIVLIGFFVSLVVMNIPLSKYKKIARVLMIGTIGILFVLKSYGSITNSAKSWLNIFGFTIQPSEFAKTAIILFLACSYGTKKNYKGKYDPFMPLVPCFVVAALVASEPDLGTALIIGGITVLIFFSIPFSRNSTITYSKMLFIIAFFLGIFILANSKNLLSETQANRFNFLRPCDRYQEDTGYQVCNGYIAINNGGFFGLGLGKSVQKYLYLPEAHTDFIFPVIVEETGLFGGFIILLLYAFLLFKLLSIARSTKDLTSSIIVYGTFSYLLLHMVVNLGGILALIPLTGVPLPFMSYGGSYMLNLIILLSLSQRVVIENKQRKYRSEFRKIMGG